MMANSGIYIHIPFCARKCRYCDFLSFEGSTADAMETYVTKLVGEISSKSIYAYEHDIDTIYIGGGTPSLLPARLIESVIDAVYARYYVTEDAEITLEVNPGTVTKADFAAYMEMGINRISLGVQSFRQEKLTYLGRIHDAAQAVSAVEAAAEAGFGNISLDLIFGTPGETVTSWLADVDRAAELGPQHISFYSLTPEEGTPVYDDIESGAVSAVSDEDDRLMYHRAIELLSERGYKHYELSNSALPGFESRHNLKYWSLGEYMGFGLGAHSYFGGFRSANTESMAEYLCAPTAESMTEWEHKNSITEDISEYIFLGLRCTDGISLRRFGAAFGRDFWELYQKETDSLIERGLLVCEGDRLKLTRLGLDLSNRVFMEYV